MLPINARAVYIKKEAYEDPRSMKRIERMLPRIRCHREVKTLDDDGWHKLVQDEHLNGMPRHGVNANDVEPIVIFNQYLYHHTDEERKRRQQTYPNLFRGQPPHYSGYGGWDWRASGDDEYRSSTGLVCQPAYAIHSFWGCHFRCAYCNLGHVANVYVNLEDWVENIRQGLNHLQKFPGQTLFQWDNGTDIVCWEPEYGGTKLLVELFAEQEDKYLELYVGKSNNVDFMLDFDHRGHTTCCWSLSTQTQAKLVEKRTASMEARLKSARKCQEAGYPVRIRFSPMVPVIGWEAETRHMIRRMSEDLKPEVLTIEPLRFCSYDQLQELFEPGVIDPDFVSDLKNVPPHAQSWEQSQFSDELRLRMYRVVLEEMQRWAPDTPVALCREKRRIWDVLQEDFARMGQKPNRYVCNCGPTSAGCNPLLRQAVAAKQTV